MLFDNLHLKHENMHLYNPEEHVLERRMERWSKQTLKTLIITALCQIRFILYQTLFVFFSFDFSGLHLKEKLNISNQACLIMRINLLKINLHCVNLHFIM